jgi:hypothetical protein
VWSGHGVATIYNNLHKINGKCHKANTQGLPTPDFENSAVIGHSAGKEELIEQVTNGSLPEPFFQLLEMN